MCWERAQQVKYLLHRHVQTPDPCKGRDGGACYSSAREGGQAGRSWPASLAALTAPGSVGGQQKKTSLNNLLFGLPTLTHMHMSTQSAFLGQSETRRQVPLPFAEDLLLFLVIDPCGSQIKNTDRKLPRKPSRCLMSCGLFPVSL